MSDMDKVVTHITDDVVEMWKHMPLEFYYDVSNRRYVGVKNYHINNGNTKLSQQVAIPKDLADTVIRSKGEKTGGALVRKKLHEIACKRIEENYKGKNKPIPTE